MLPVPLSDVLEETADRLAQSPRVLLLLDFDGTLAPLTDAPAEARIPETVVQSLRRLSTDARVVVGIVSGRQLDDLMRSVGLRNLVYAGEFGLEVQLGQTRYRREAALALQPELEALEEEVEAGVGGQQGVVVECKQLSATVHLRRAEAGTARRAGEVCRRIVSGYPHFQMGIGRSALDITPAIGWDKGEAVKWIRRESGMEAAAVLYAGDDDSDERAFRALAGQVTIKVGESDTCAAMWAEAPEVLWRLLQRMDARLAAAEAEAVPRG